MKKYTEPDLKVVILNSADIIATSTPKPPVDDDDDTDGME